MTLEILYTAWNRAGFVQRTFPWLLAHTHWDLVRKLVVYDDGSEDGTQEYLRDTIGECPIDHELRVGDFRSPPAIMNHYLATCEVSTFAKIDSDIALPGGWLKTMVQVLQENPKVDLLGMESGQVARPDDDAEHTVEPCHHIGGVGLMRVKPFRKYGRIPERGRFGFTEHQERYAFRAAWIKPDLRVPQLDRVPRPPFQGLSIGYIENGWQRKWQPYGEEMLEHWEWMDLPEWKEDEAA